MNMFQKNSLDAVIALNDLLMLLNSLNNLLESLNTSSQQEELSHRWWVAPVDVHREEQGAAANLVKEIIDYDPESFFKFTRLNKTTFSKLLSLVGPKLVKYSIRKSIAPETRLLVTLRFLATGDSFRSLHCLFRIGGSTVRNIVHETCEALFQTLRLQCMPPLTKESFEATSTNFQTVTKFPHVIGAIDGKHINIFAPPKAETAYYNSKKTFSIVLLGVCDSYYRFIYCNVGGYESEPDGGIFGDSALREDLESEAWELPTPKRIYNSSFGIPYFLLGDAAFPFREYLMTPFCGQNLSESEAKYNLELSKGRSAIENSFGVLCARWQVLLNRLQISPEKADKIVLATVLLHNFVISENSEEYITKSYVDHYLNDNLVQGEWRKDVGDRNLQSSSFSTCSEETINTTAKTHELRESIKNLLFENILQSE